MSITLPNRRKGRAAGADPGGQDPGSAASSRAASDHDKPIGDLAKDILDDLSSLFRQEVALAKAELKVEAIKAGKGAGMFGVAAFAGYMFLVLASFAAAFGLGSLIGLGWATLIVGGVWGLIALVLALTGGRIMRTISPAPKQTIETLKEDVEWAKNLRN